MKVSKAIELLRDNNPDEEICISWWESNLFTTGDDETPLSADSDGWLSAVQEFDSSGGYASVNEDIWTLLYQAINEVEVGY
jgi:hypothetical protein